jgi:hypothetical protein
VRFALRFTVLVQRHHTRHPAPIFGRHGVIAEEDGAPLHGDALILTPDKGAPTREQPRQVPRRGAKEMESG